MLAVHTQEEVVVETIPAIEEPEGIPGVFHTNGTLTMCATNMLAFRWCRTVTTHTERREHFPRSLAYNPYPRMCLRVFIVHALDNHLSTA